MCHSLVCENCLFFFFLFFLAVQCFRMCAHSSASFSASSSSYYQIPPLSTYTLWLRSVIPPQLSAIVDIPTHLSSLVSHHSLAPPSFSFLFFLFPLKAMSRVEIATHYSAAHRIARPRPRPPSPHHPRRSEAVSDPLVPSRGSVCVFRTSSSGLLSEGLGGGGGGSFPFWDDRWDG